MTWVWLLNEERLGWLVEGRRFARCANAHLYDDKTVAKMGHPVYGAGQSSRLLLEMTIFWVAEENRQGHEQKRTGVTSHE